MAARAVEAHDQREYRQARDRIVTATARAEETPQPRRERQRKDRQR